MRPNLMTIAVVPAVCGALVGVGVVEGVLRYATPQTAPITADKKSNLPPAAVAPNLGTGVPPATNEEKSSTSKSSAGARPSDKVEKDNAP